MKEPNQESLPPKYSARYLRMHLDKAREGFWQAAAHEGITGHTPACLERIDAALSDDLRTTFAREGCPDPELASLWFTYAIFGSYFGDLLVHNLDGHWRYPNSLVALLGLTFGRPDWIYRRWYVVVGHRKIPVFVIAMRRHTLGREKASLVKAYEEVARTCGSPDQGKGARL